MAAKYFLFLPLLLTIIPSDCAPKRGKKGDNTPHTVYDQKQTGDYNIQLHLKDFQIIALFGDDSNSFGDYDYSYDYSDFTVKPGTQKPTEISVSTSIPTVSSTNRPITASTSKFTSPFYQIITDTPNKNPTEKPAITETIIINEKPHVNNKPATQEKPNSINNNQTISDKPLLNEKPILTDKPITANEKPSTAESSLLLNFNSTYFNASTTQKSPKFDDINSPGKIKVQIIETPVHMGIVPGEDLPEHNETLPQGEILHLKRCATGFTRDKRGRCRRVRRPGNIQPQLSYGFSRLASNLASRFRKTSEESSASLLETKED